MTGGLFDRLRREMDAKQRAAGLTMADVLALPDVERRLFNWMMREGEVTLSEVAAHEGQGEEAARAMLSPLVARGFVRETLLQGEMRYRVRLAPKRGRGVPLNIWQALDGKVER